MRIETRLWKVLGVTTDGSGLVRIEDPETAWVDYEGEPGRGQRLLIGERRYVVTSLIPHPVSEGLCLVHAEEEP